MVTAWYNFVDVVTMGFIYLSSASWVEGFQRHLSGFKDKTVAVGSIESWPNGVFYILLIAFH